MAKSFKLSTGMRQPVPFERIEVTKGLSQKLTESPYSHARQCCQAGDQAMRAGQVETAVKAYQEAIAIDPTYLRAYHNLGIAYSMQQDWNRARACFVCCAELAPEEADLHFKIGLYALKQDRIEEAQKAFEAAIQHDPDHLDARFQCALLYARGGSLGPGRRVQAINSLEYILQACDRGVPYADLDRVCFVLASFLDDTPENRERAISVYRRGLDINPLFAQGHNNLGVLLMQAGQIIPALGAFKIAIQLEPDYRLPYRNLARLLFYKMSPAEMEREYASITEEFGVRAAAVLARLSLELIDLGRAQVYESLYTHGHQIKNLMGVMGSRMRRTLRTMPPESPGLADLQAIAREQERIYDQWVAYLRSMKPGIINPTLVDVPQLVHKVIQSVSLHLGRSNLTFSAAEQVPHIKADPHMLREAVANLVINAIEAVNKNVDKTGQVKVQTGYDRNRASVYIEVEDNGPGIAKSQQSRIFDPGFSTKPKGNGYGLSICSQIVSVHRGNLRVMSRPGAGTVFRIDLPIDFELASEETKVSLQGMPGEVSRGPIAEEFID